jgi:hypothetical protein
MDITRRTRSISILRWWRRWHHARARFYHYRRREGVAAGPLSVPATAPTALVPAEDMLDVVWKRFEPLLPPTDRVGRP